jgi:BirA family biotin operon repressor/biotin-[acetyl-CoA-carboxylase] ligase
VNSSPLSRTATLLLRSLRAQQGQWISGAVLCRQLQVSRTAVWKHIGALKTFGYRIESSPRRGYLLREIPDRLVPQELREGLQTTVIGRAEIHYFPCTESTNRQAKTLAGGGAPSGTLVLAEEQTAGRGRRGRSWFSPPGAGIYLSVILRPDITPQEAPRFALATAAAVAAAVQETTLVETRIKWPNDILAGGRKLGGILTEAVLEMDRVEYLIIGLGLNVNLDRIDFPQDLRETATSIQAETGRWTSRIVLTRRILESLETTYHEYRQRGFAPILQRWEALTEMKGRRVAVDVMGRTYTGEVTHFDADGCLVIREAGGEAMRLFSGDVNYLG